MQTLLLVDDEPNIVEGLASQFEGRYGGDVIVLKSFSGLHALSILQNNKVDVVLSDIRHAGYGRPDFAAGNGSAVACTSISCF